PARGNAGADADNKSKVPSTVAANAAKAATKASPSKTRRSGRENTLAAESKNRGVRLTHPDRVYWVDVGVTKQDLADFYREVWDWMAPHVIGRPLALVRCPDGTKGECFFQKHASAGLTEQNLRTVIDGKGRQIIAIDNVEGLLSLVQTSVAAYSTRGRSGAPVSAPVSWQEVGRTTGGNQYTVLNLMKRLGGLKQDPWQDISRVKQALPDLQTLRKRG